MTRQVINFGSAGNDGTGDGLRAAAIKIENNFGDLYSHANSVSNPHNVTAVQVGAIPSGEKNAAGGVAGLDGSGKLNSSQKPTYTLNEIVSGDLGFSLTPSLNATHNLGSSSKYWNTLYVANVVMSGNSVITNWNADKVDGLDASSFVRTDSNSTIANPYSLSFGNETRQMLNLYASGYGIGVQSATTYIRTGGRFSVFSGGSHSNTENVAGAGGTVLLTAKSSDGSFQFLGNSVWHSGNDGSGSSLDADLLDGQHGSYYQNATHLTAGTIADARLPTIMSSKTFSGSPIVSTTQANMSLNSVSGNSGALRYETDGLLRWAIMQNGDTESGSNTGANFRLVRYDDTGVYIDSPIAIARSTGVVAFVQSPTVGGNSVWHSGNDGSGSSLDADLLDGQHGSYYQNAANLTGTISDSRLPASMTGKKFTSNVVIGEMAESYVHFSETSAGDGFALFFAGSSSDDDNLLQIRGGSGSPAGMTPHISVKRNTGRVMLGTTTDNGVDRLQINGSAIVTQLKSSVGNGTAPFQVSSNTVVTNLNADLLDGQHGSYYQNASNLISGVVPNERIVGSYNFSRVMLDDGSAASPSYSFTSDPDTGITSSSGNTLHFVTGGATRASFNTSGLYGQNSSSFYFFSRTSTSTVPTIVHHRGNTTTGIGGESGEISLIAGSAEMVKVTASAVTVNAPFAHGGLTPTAGTNVDQIATFALSMTLTDDWQDTSINATDLATGTYIVQVLIDDDENGGTQNTEYYSGVMSWYSGDTDSVSTDEITLHRAGISPGSNAIFLRVARTFTASADDMVLQISGTNDNVSASTITLKFRRMI